MEQILNDFFMEKKISNYRVISHIIKHKNIKYPQKNNEEITLNNRNFILINFIYNGLLFNLKTNLINHNTIKCLNLLINANLGSTNYLDFNINYNKLICNHSETIRDDVLTRIESEFEEIKNINFFELNSFEHSIILNSNKGDFHQKNTINFINFSDSMGNIYHGELKNSNNSLIEMMKQQQVSIPDYSIIKSEFEELNITKFTKQPIMLIMHFLEYLLHSYNVLSHKSYFNKDNINLRIFPECVSLHKNVNPYFNVDVEGSIFSESFLIKHGYFVDIISNKKMAFDLELSGSDAKFNYFTGDISISPGTLFLDISKGYSNHYTEIIDFIDPINKKFNYLTGELELVMYGKDAFSNRYKKYTYKSTIFDLLSKISNVASDVLIFDNYMFKELIFDFKGV